MLGNRLKAVQFDHHFVSDLGRTRETFAELMEGKQLQGNVTYSPLLREKAGGVFEGGPLVKLAQAAKLAHIPIRKFRPENGECWEDVFQRSRETVKLVFFDAFVRNSNCNLV